jgi:hypothetical protein
VARATVFPTYNLSCLPELPGSAKSGLWQYRQIDSPFLSNLPMLLKDSSQVEKEFRSFLRARPLKLSSLTLPIAFDAMAEFWTTTRFSNVLTEGGDGIACYQDVTDHGRGTRLEIGFIRLLRLQSDCSLPPSPVHRLRLRICYKWDMDVIKHLLPAGTWSFACWDSRARRLQTGDFRYCRIFEDAREKASGGKYFVRHGDVGTAPAEARAWSRANVVGRHVISLYLNGCFGSVRARRSHR